MYYTLISTQPLDLSTQYRQPDEYIIIDPHSPLHDYHHNHIQQAITKSHNKIIILTNAISLHPHCISEIMLSFESDTSVKLTYNTNKNSHIIAFKKNITLNIPFIDSQQPSDYKSYLQSLSTRSKLYLCHTARIQ